jgi:serine/threonine-protein kinase
VSEPLERLVLQCLEKNPNKRPQTALEVADRLRALALADGWTLPLRQAWWKEAAEKTS